MLANVLLASASASNQYAQQVQQLRAADSSTRANLQKAQAAAGPDTLVTSNVTYAIGPDGTRYATGGTISKTTRSRESDNDVSRLGRSQFAADPRALEAQGTRNNALAPAPKSLSELLNPQLSLSPLEFALAFNDESFSENTQRAKLRNIDAGVRSQESLHFRAAGGLAEGIAQYGTEVGPDGELYATSGRVNVRPTASADPAKAARDAITVSHAATAPGDASAQDFFVSRAALSQAAQLYRQAQPEPPVFNLIG